MGTDTFTVQIGGAGPEDARVALLADLDVIADRHREIIQTFRVAVPPVAGETVSLRQPTAVEEAEAAERAEADRQRAEAEAPPPPDAITG